MSVTTERCEQVFFRATNSNSFWCEGGDREQRGASPLFLGVFNIPSASPSLLATLGRLLFGHFFVSGSMSRYAVQQLCYTSCVQYTMAYFSCCVVCNNYLRASRRNPPEPSTPSTSTSPRFQKPFVTSGLTTKEAGTANVNTW